jgi:hypothetical protein
MPTKRATTNTTAVLEAFADGLEAIGIDPGVVEVSLPLSDWRHLAQDQARRAGARGKLEIGGVPYLIR